MIRVGLTTRFIEKLFGFNNIKDSYKNTIGLIKEYKDLLETK